jgi:hypothetical protein
MEWLAWKKRSWAANATHAIRQQYFRIMLIEWQFTWNYLMGSFFETW